LPNLTHTPRRARLAALAVAAVALFAFLGRAPLASAGPPSVRLISTPGTIVPIPASVPHEAGAMIDSRLVPDLRWLAEHFPIYVSEGYSGPLPNGGWSGCHGCHVAHSDHYNGMAVDIVPLHDTTTCDANWRGVTRLAQWAEPQQNQPVAPFRWVGYEGDAGHGCGNHLHLSWEHAPAASYTLAEWVDVFAVGAPSPSPRPAKKAPVAKHRRGPTGGFATSTGGGLPAGGD
jgi:hypothetical protein